MSQIQYELYKNQMIHWPSEGRHIMAQYDDDSIIIYQAYRKSIADYAVTHQRFGGEFSYSRMSWIKPNFLWMMFRAGWAGKEGQEHILAVRLKRTFFEEILINSVSSAIEHSSNDELGVWQEKVAKSDIRLQWDPDHDPFGAPIKRRAVQLGLRGDMLRRYGHEELISIEDITPFVKKQKENVNGKCQNLLVPSEKIYVPNNTAATNIGLDNMA